ncbi:response regulator transcription factor [Butyrivibrio sp. LC3010]|uniref:response regulator transcription factor n=1 Tax=Butyrivibrio sp. LC3010 TaxID=1280680 RepID=UPI0003FE2F2E|nr:response regulator [Butyrivibrio sp. LC3010]
MTLLIVDDEFLLVQGVKKTIDWNALGITEVYEAYSADQARAVYEEHQIDILLSDVEMPRENGLSLIHWVKENGYNSVNILLTGHANFDYAREGISLQILDYVLKPIEQDSLTKVLKKAVEEVLSIKEERAAKIAQAADDLWQYLFDGTLSPDPDSIAEYIDNNFLPDGIADRSYYYAYLQVHSPDDAFSVLPVKSIVGELFTEHFNITIVDRSCFMLSICLPINAAADYEKGIVSRLSNVTERLSKSYPNCKFLFYSFADAPLSAAPYAYELLAQYSKSIISSESKVISIMNPELSNISAKTREHSERIEVEKWEQLLSEGRCDDVLLSIKGLLMQTDTTFSSGFLRSIYYGLLSAVFAVLSQKNCSPTRISTEMARTADPRSITSSVNGLINWAKSLLRTFSDVTADSGNEENTVLQIKQFIKDHLSDADLSRTTIAEAVHISPDYLSYFFHKESGEVLSSYVNGERIAAAKKLLINSQASSQEIAEKTGFSNVSYFHKQFKKATGLTPNAYRSEFKNK